MALLLQHQEANQLRGNLSAFFVFSSIISLVVQIPVGFFNLHHLIITLPLLPAAAFGYWLAIKTTQSLPKEKVRFGALALCFISGITAVIQVPSLIANIGPFVSLYKPNLLYRIASLFYLSSQL